MRSASISPTPYFNELIPAEILNRSFVASAADTSRISFAFLAMIPAHQIQVHIFQTIVEETLLHDKGMNRGALTAYADI
jgi:hypothetical protein